MNESAREVVGVGLGENPSIVERSAARLLAQEIERRTGLPGDTFGPADAQRAVLLGTPDSSEEIRRAASTGAVPALAEAGSEGFTIAGPAEGTVVAANRPAGVLYGVGRLLREAVLDAGTWLPPSQPARAGPALPVRCIYFAPHMGNWYCHASPAEIRDYLDQMALWGYNELMTVVGVLPGETFDDAVRRVAALHEHARGVGMRVGTVVQANTSFDRPPPEFAATSGPIPGAFDVCPSKPGARQFLLQDKRRFLPLLAPVDFLCLWPYDGGGCYCDQCAPWAKTYLHLAREIAEQAVDASVEVRLSAWFFEREVPGEDDALFEYLRAEPSWFRYIVAGAAEARRWRRDRRRLPDPYRVLLFPDIAMFDGAPWGGRGANPAPRKFARELSDAREMLDGAIVYSEGRYDDINKILWAQMLWDPERDPADIAREYCRWYFGPPQERVTADLILDIEQGMEDLPDPERWRRGVFHPEWDAQAAEIESQLAPDVRDDWRWRLLRAKTEIEKACSALSDPGLGAEARQRSLEGLRVAYERLQFTLNLHDPERSLATWVYAPLEEAFAANLLAGAGGGA